MRLTQALLLGTISPITFLSVERAARIEESRQAASFGRDAIVSIEGDPYTQMAGLITNDKVTIKRKVGRHAALGLGYGQHA